jgi:hypothetical protein
MIRNIEPTKTVTPPELIPPAWFRLALAIAQHEDTKRSWSRYARLGHWLLVSWRCPCCKANRKGKK